MKVPGGNAFTTETEMAKARQQEQRIYFKNMTNTDLVLQSKTTIDNNMIVFIYRRELIIPPGGVVLEREKPEEGFGAIMFDDKRPKEP